jgi:hypothetical protein
MSQSATSKPALTIADGTEKQVYAGISALRFQAITIGARRV